MKSYIEDRKEIDRVILSCGVCRLGLSMDDSPYVVPVSFGYDCEAVYIHTGLDGKKIRYFKANPSVCLEFEGEARVVRSEKDSCGWSFAYESVIGYGKIEEVLDPAAKIYGLNRIMLQYSGREWEFNEAVVRRTRVWRIRVDSVRGKRADGAV